MQKAFGWRKAGLSLALALAGLGLAAFAQPDPAAAGFFDRLFGGMRRAVEAPRPPPSALPFMDPFTSLSNALNPQQQQQRGAGGPSRGFCVRTCDGRYFPVQANAGMSAAESCQAFCPASETRVYGGSSIDYAMAADGTRYANLPSAFLFRKQLVAGCTCNGRNAFGLAHIEASEDPTLRPGDIVATKNGLVAFTGNRNNVAGFTPVENYARLSKATREKLADTKIMPASPVTPPTAEVTSSITPAGAGQASR